MHHVDDFSIRIAVSYLLN